LQLPALQQPVAQELGPQPGVELPQLPWARSHDCPSVEQLTQVVPPRPHAVSSRELTHWLPWQQVLQVAVPHAATPWQEPPTQL